MKSTKILVLEDIDLLHASINKPLNRITIEDIHWTSDRFIDEASVVLFQNSKGTVIFKNELNIPIKGYAKTHIRPKPNFLEDVT